MPGRTAPARATARELGWELEKEDSDHGRLEGNRSGSAAEGCHLIALQPSLSSMTEGHWVRVGRVTPANTDLTGEEWIEVKNFLLSYVYSGFVRDPSIPINICQVGEARLEHSSPSLM